MKIKTLVSVILLSLGMVLTTQAQVVSRAYEVALVNFRAPTTANGSATFSTCDTCPRQLVRVTPDTRYTISKRAVRLEEFRKALKDAAHRPNAAVTVLHHLESDTIKSINVSL